MRLTTQVSILIPVYNRDAIISETIQSALDQTYKNIEVIIVDNASTDYTWEKIQVFAKENPHVKAFRNESNLGPVRNWLRCVKEASGEYGKILWSDDLIAPDFIEKTLPLFNDEVGFVYTGANIFTGANPLEARTSYLLSKSRLYPASMYIGKVIFDKGMPVSPGCAIFRMSDIRKNLWLQIPNQAGSNFSKHAIGNDLLLFLLTAKDYNYFGHVAEPLSFFRAHKGSISSSSKSGKILLHYAIAKAYFVENYSTRLLSCYASYLIILLWRYKKDSNEYGINHLNKFFKNKVNFNKTYLAKELVLNLLKLPVLVLNKFLYLIIYYYKIFKKIISLKYRNS